MKEGRKEKRIGDSHCQVANASDPSLARVYLVRAIRAAESTAPIWLEGLYPMSVAISRLPASLAGQGRVGQSVSTSLIAVNAILANSQQRWTSGCSNRTNMPASSVAIPHCLGERSISFSSEKRGDEAVGGSIWACPLVLHLSKETDAVRSFFLDDLNSSPVCPGSCRCVCCC